jgi:hypothetical protein
MRFTRFSFWTILPVLTLAAGCAAPKPHPDPMLAAVSQEAMDTHARVENLTALISVLQDQITALQASNAELQREVQALQGRQAPGNLRPPQFPPWQAPAIPRPPQSPPWSPPHSNGVPPLTPLENQ